MSEENAPKVITFGDERSPEKDKEYYDRISKARSGAGNVNALKGRDDLGFAPKPTGVPIIQNEKSGDLFKPIDDMQKGAAMGVQPRPAGSPLLSKETAQQLQDMAKAQAEQSAQQPAEKKDDEEFDIADFLSTSDPIARILDNPKRRKEIEGRLTPMKFEDLLYKDEVRQTVPVKPGAFEVTFRSITPEENLFIKQFVSKQDSQSAPAYLGELYTLCQLAAATVALNGRDLPQHLKQDGTVDEKAFDTKLNVIKRKSGYVIADLSVQYRWFDIRVRKLIQPDDLKNG